MGQHGHTKPGLYGHRGGFTTEVAKLTPHSDNSCQHAKQYSSHAS